MAELENRRKGLGSGLLNQRSQYPNFSLSNDLTGIKIYPPIGYINKGQSIYDFANIGSIPNVELQSFEGLPFGIYVYDNSGIKTYEIVVGDVIDVSTLTPPVKLVEYPAGATVLYEAGLLNTSGGPLTTGVDTLFDGMSSFGFPRGGSVLHTSRPPIIYFDGTQFVTTYDVRFGLVGLGSGSNIIDDFVFGNVWPDGEDIEVGIAFFDNDLWIVDINSPQFQNVIATIRGNNGTGNDWTRGSSVPGAINREIINYEAQYLGSHNTESDFNNTKIKPFEGQNAAFGGILYVYDGSNWQQLSGSGILTEVYLGTDNNASEGKFNSWQDAYNAIVDGILPKTINVLLQGSTYPILDEGAVYDNLNISLKGYQTSSNVGFPVSMTVNNSSHAGGQEIQFSLPKYMENIALNLVADNPSGEILRRYESTPFNIEIKNSIIENAGGSGNFIYSLIDSNFVISLYGNSRINCFGGPLVAIAPSAFLDIHLYDDARLNGLIDTTTIRPEQLRIHIHSPNITLDSVYVNNVNCHIIFHTFSAGDMLNAFVKGYGNIATTNDTVTGATRDDTLKQLTITVGTGPVASIATVGDRVNLDSILMSFSTPNISYGFVTAIDNLNDTMTVQFPSGTIDPGTYVSGGTVEKEDVRSLGFLAQEIEGLNWKCLFETSGGGSQRVKIEGLNNGNIAQLYDCGGHTGSHDISANGTIQRDKIMSQIRHSFTQIDGSTLIGFSTSDLSLGGIELLLIMNAANNDEIIIKTLSIGN